ncbi:epoxide hydrolase family protein [Rhizorhapis suberifaciens]|uniref:Pimeloyl-ACP methyl ester carboxylesterase n=1 Tax=Rhizorhapis suberifaciens TaxID=13656 RepID=A0A840HXZ6_9SPHN|nr:epoxide hydrolase family protein [Rhizorhapis suberifaciens]MBB4642863.1 pimeloyl-ACP methyl ester carboxylesterase [Rhizorhapis suberifaciens]
MPIEEFSFHIADEVIQDVLNRVRRSPWPRRLGDGGWGYGVSHDFMRRFVSYWTNDYDWRKTEAELNGWPQFRVAIGDFKIHFYHISGEAASPRPLLLTHGWPGSVLEFLHMIGPLTHPSRYGGRAEDAFSVVIPSAPGFAASEFPDGQAMGPVTTADLWRTLMVDILDYERFGVHGGDFGAIVNIYMAARFPAHVAALHLNMFPVAMGPHDELSEEEAAYAEECRKFAAREFGYMNLHSMKPNTVAFALAGNPLGTAAWILEKFYAWSDNGGDILDAFTLDQLCANVSLYAFTDTIDTSIRFYEGFNRELGGVYRPFYKIDVPTAMAIFPRELLPGRPPRSWAERQYDVRRWTEMPRGGHFAAMEQPDLLLTDIQTFFRDYL